MASFTSPSSSMDREDAIEALRMHLVGDEVLEVGQGVDVRGEGVFAATKLESGSLLVRVALRACITPDRVLGCDALKPVFEAAEGLKEYPDEVLALGLMYGRLTEGCAWHKHCKAMPQSIDTPIFWSEEEHQKLDQLNNYFVSNILKRQMQSDWASIHAPLVEAFPEVLSGADKKLYDWALSMVYSRAVGIRRKGEYTRCIAPVVDMANHYPRQGKHSADAFHFDENNDTLEIKTCVDVDAGDECYAIYGHYSNAKLLHTYGFVLPGEAPLAMDVWPNIAHHLNTVATKVSPDLADRKKRVLEALRLLEAAADYKFDGSIRASRNGEVHVDGRLMRVARIMEATEDEVKLMCRPGYQGDRVSKKNEVASMLALKELFLAVRDRVSKGGTTTDKDGEDEVGPALPPAMVDDAAAEYRALCARTVRGDDCLVLEYAAQMMGAKAKALQQTK